MGIPDVPFLWVVKVRFKTRWARNDWEQDMPKNSTCAHAARRLPQVLRSNVQKWRCYASWLSLAFRL